MPKAADSERKLCGRCGETKPRDEFGYRYDKKYDRYWTQPYCRPCRTSHERERYQRLDVRRKYAVRDQEAEQKWPERARARRLARKALRQGQITRRPCYAASDECRGRVVMHHPDYDKPFDVTFTCDKHHPALDEARRAAEQQPHSLPLAA